MLSTLFQDPSLTGLTAGRICVQRPGFEPRTEHLSSPIFESPRRHVVDCRRTRTTPPINAHQRISVEIPVKYVRMNNAVRPPTPRAQLLSINSATKTCGCCHTACQLFPALITPLFGGGGVGEVWGSKPKVTANRHFCLYI